MNRFNLTFSGEILAGHDPAAVKLRFGKLFAIDDPVRLERFFSGQLIILRRNLERKAAAQYYHELHLLGVAAALVKVTASESVDALLKTAPAPAGTKPEKAPRATTDIAAQLKARKAESLRLAAEQAARDQARREEQQRRAEEDNAREQARAEEARRSAEEAAARKAAERALTKRREAEDAARKQAAQVESQRQAAAEAARVKALREEQKAERARQKAAAAAQRRVELEQIRQREAEEAARVQAELAELKRREAEEAARQQAEQEEIERQEAAEAARLQAELAQIKLQEAQEAARIKAETQRREEEAQRQSAERRRLAAEQLAAQRAQRKEEKRIAAARQAELKAQQAQAARHRAREAARLKAEERRRQTLQKQEHAALKESLQEQVVHRAAAELAQAKGLNTSGVRAAPSTEARKQQVPDIDKVASPAPRKRQLGEPNLYKLRPFRNTDEVRARAATARQRMRRGYTLGAIAFAALFIAGGYFLRHPLTPAISGATAIAIDARSAPLLLAGSSLLFHDRAGVSTQEKSLRTLAVAAMQAPLAFDSSGALLALGRLDADDTAVAAGPAQQLLRCELEASRCERFSPALRDSSIDVFVIHPLDGSLLLADHAAGELLKITRSGQIVARASTAIPRHPVLRLHGGLLLMNSTEGPGISVFRYEDNAFGQQLDEILLLPPHLQEAENIRVDDFLWSSGTWWASLSDPAAGIHGLYRFDEEWNYRDEVAVPGKHGPLQLVSWGEKTLINDLHNPAMQRFNASGTAEAPFVSSTLKTQVARDQRSTTLTTAAWRGGLLLLALAALLGLGFGYLQSLRALVYKPGRERGAEPVDEHADALRWIDPVPQRSVLLRRRGVSYALLAAGILLVAVAQSVTVWQLAALLLALSGPAIALLLLSRHSVGHIGILQDRLLLVDHSGLYHLAGGSGVQHFGPFLAIDDVVVFAGNALLPAFSSPQLQKQVIPLAVSGVKVDRNTIVVKLLQGRHPIAQGAGVILVATVAAGMLLCLQGIY